MSTPIGIGSQGWRKAFSRNYSGVLPRMKWEQVWVVGEDKAAP